MPPIGPMAVGLPLKTVAVIGSPGVYLVASVVTVTTAVVGSGPASCAVQRDWRRIWRPAEQSTLFPYAGGIHRVQNVGSGAAVSLHLYGPRASNVDGRDYDPARDFVCDRLAA